MSYTTLAVVFEDGEIKSGYEFRNGWGSAPFIWDKIATKYRIGAPWQFGGPGLNDWEKVWKYHQDGGALDPAEHNALVSTYDRTVVKRDDMLALADSFERFVELHPPGNRVCSLPDQAKAIREAHEKGARFIAWTQTSVSDPWWYGLSGQEEEGDEEDDSRYRYNVNTGTGHTIGDILPLHAATAPGGQSGGHDSAASSRNRAEQG